MNSKNKQLADLLSLPIQQKQKRRIEWTPNTIPKVPMGYKSRILDHFYGKYNTQECVRQHTTLLGGRVVKCTGIISMHFGCFVKENF